MAYVTGSSVYFGKNNNVTFYASFKHFTVILIQNMHVVKLTAKLLMTIGLIPQVLACNQPLTLPH